MDPLDHSREARISNQHINAQSRHNFPGHAGNYSSMGTGDANNLRSMLPGNYAKSKGSSSASFVSTAPTTADTATTPRTSSGSSSSAHSKPSGHNKQETAAATASTQSEDATTKDVMLCVCCWYPNKDLTRHYPKCPYIKGDWAFFACSYTLEITRNREVFTNHIKSFKPDEKRIEVILTRPDHIVTARTWALQYTERAMIRQLVNIVFTYFEANPGLADEWKALNNNELIPNLKNVVDVLKLCSIMLRRRTTSGSDRFVEEVSIDQLQKIFRADATVVPKALRHLLSKKRQRNDTPVPYTALEIVNRDAKVEIGDARLDSAELAARQQQQLAGQNQERSVCYGGVIVHPPSVSRAPTPANAVPTARTPIALGGQTQGMSVAANNTSNNPAEVHYRQHHYSTDHSGLEPPPPMSQILQQGQSVDVLTGANDHFRDSDDDNLDDFDHDYWDSLLNDSDYSN